METSDSLSDLPVEGAVGNSANPLPPGLTEEEAEELRTELTKVMPRCSQITRCLHVTILYVTIVWVVAAVDYLYPGIGALSRSYLAQHRFSQDVDLRWAE